MDLKAEDFSVTMAGVRFEHPIVNAGGTCKTIEDVERFARNSAVSAIELGSVTGLMRKENEGNTYGEERDRFGNLVSTTNCCGMPNGGIPYAEHHLSRMVEIARFAGKRFIVNVAGVESPEEFVDLVDAALSVDIDVLVCNFGCPNIVWDNMRHEAPISSNSALVHHILSLIDELWEEYIMVDGPPAYEPVPILLKWSPVDDIGELIDKVRMAHEFSFVRGHVLVNTLPDFVLRKANGKPVITVPGVAGKGGMGGPRLRPYALEAVRAVHTMRERGEIPRDTGIIAAGGVITGADVWEFRHEGADLVSAASAYFAAGEDERAYNGILKEYVYECERRGLPRQ